MDLAIIMFEICVVVGCLQFVLLDFNKRYIIMSLLTKTKKIKLYLV